MKFGKLENIDLVDFSMPTDPPVTRNTLNGLKANYNPTMYIGCPVWADKGFVGKIYPEKTSSKDFLYHYCRQFNSVELNATHYNIPAPSTIKKWKETATSQFKFCPKFPQVISHHSDFHKQTDLINLFLNTIKGLDESLGYSFIQFPPYFDPSQLDNLIHFLENLPKDFKIAVELRHKEWFNNTKIQQNLTEILSAFKVPLVITDVAGRRDVMHQILTSDTVFIRFTGNHLHTTDYTRIDAWVKKLINWIEQGLKTIYFFMHQPEEYLCVEIASYMIKSLNKTSYFNVKAPQVVAKQGSLF